MNETHSISVVIPMYNAEKTILQALNSVKKQSCGNVFEIFVVNDGSTDQSQKIVEEFISNNPAINITIINQNNQGVSAARNAGLKRATGDFIALLDSDDEWHLDKTERQMKVFLENIDAVDFLATTRNNEKIGWPYFINSKNNLAKISFRKLLIRNVAATPTVIFKRKILDAIGYFDPLQKHAEDAHFWLKISGKFKMYILAENLVTTGSGKKSFGESGLSANLKEMEKGFQKNLKEMHQQKRLNNFEYAFFYVISKIKYLSRPLRLLLKP
ncbi:MULTISPECIES: glycosyltransferase family 2 protein [Amniculibacterium]|uniref:glycosyltransferase family 2 protein n=1 Tax=Amniculibacterium TaxID=2715289 RepID=UPI000F59AA34|nr:MULTISPECIES: glycosyltransferase family A protein [Amniculibacterium]